MTPVRQDGGHRTGKDIVAQEMKGGRAASVRQEAAQEAIDLRCPWERALGTQQGLGSGPASMDYLRGAWQRKHTRRWAEDESGGSGGTGKRRGLFWRCTGRQRRGAGRGRGRTYWSVVWRKTGRPNGATHNTPTNSICPLRLSQSQLLLDVFADCWDRWGTGTPRPPAFLERYFPVLQRLYEHTVALPDALQALEVHSCET